MWFAEFGNKVYYGDAMRARTCSAAAGADRAKLLVVALDDIDRNLRTVETAKRNHPNLTVVSRARNRHHVHLLMDRDIRWHWCATDCSSLQLAALCVSPH